MLKNLKKCLKSEKKDISIFDIILYGSVVKGKRKPSDVDLLVVFKEGTLRERLDKIQKIKKKLDFERLDIKQATLHDLFKPGFMARKGILLEGESVFNSRKFSEGLGFKGFSLFNYTLLNLKHNEKVKFNYILSGRDGAEGVIRYMGGEKIGDGVVMIPIEKSLEFENILISNKIKFTKRDILI